MVAVSRKDIFNYLSDDPSLVFEKEPLVNLAHMTNFLVI